MKRHPFISTLITMIFLSLPLQAQERIALLIGNSAYEHVPELRNPGNDSSDIAAVLADAGFEVILHTDQTQSSMLDTLRSFRRRANGAEIALIYYAGHGIEIDRQNYLIPVDAVLETDSDINFEAVPLDTMIFAAQGAKRLSMVIVDACRDNPFASTIKRENSSRSIGRGLSAVEPSRNTLVAYAAKEGTTAADGAGRNSPYASALIQSLKEPRIEVGLMMRQVRDSVLEATNGQQEPFVYGSLSADQIFLNDTRGLSVVQPDDIAPKPGPSAAEIAFWQSVSAGTNVEELQSYLDRYPEGIFAELAQVRLRGLAEQGTEPIDPFVPLAPAVAMPEPQTPEDPPARALERNEIIELQERLSVLGHSLGRADGIAGQRTEAAIRAFEETQGLSVSGQATFAVLVALRDQVTDVALKDWRAEQAAAAARAEAAQDRARKQAQARAATQQIQAPSTPKPAPAETQASDEISPAYKQFCASHRQCSTSSCRVGNSGLSWRKTQQCRFCPLYVQRCQ